MKNKRRDFLRTACAPVLMTVLGIPMIEACSSGDSPSEPTNNNTNNSTDPVDTSVTIDLNESNFNSLGEIGGWMNYLEEQMLLIRISDTEIRAFDNRCPHQGNRDGWTFDGTEFTCSYHENSYSNSCNGGLDCLTSSIEGNILTVSR